MAGSLVPESLGADAGAPARRSIADYYLGEPLGVGATGQIFRARHGPTGREVALKILHGRAAGGGAAAEARRLDALLDGFRAAKALRHPHLVEVLDVGAVDGVGYVATELFGHGSLRTALQEAGGALPLPVAVDVVRQAAEGLAYAHEHGLLHGHLTPEDLLLRPARGGGASADGASADGDGRPAVKVSDAAAAAAAAGAAGAAAGAVPLVLGTTLASAPASALPYISPEQTRGAAFDARSDVYALGVLLYEAVTGYPPFQVRTPNEAAFKHARQPPAPPITQRPEVPPALQDVMLRCLAKAPNERYTTMAAMREALEPFWPAVEAPIERHLVVVPERDTPPPKLERWEAPRPPRLALTLDRTTVALTPGQPEVVRAVVRNVGPIVDHVRVAVDGVPEAWVRVAPAGAHLMPRAEAAVTITVLVPRAPEARAGDYAVTVRAVSQEAPAESPAVPAAWTVLPFAAAALDLAPVRNSGWRRAGYTARLRNDGNAPARYALVAAADEPGLAFALDPADAGLAGGEELDVRVAVHTRLRWFGAPETRPFSVRAVAGGAALDAASLESASLDDGAPAALAPGQFVRRAVLPAWLLAPLVLLLCFLGWLAWKATRPALPTVQPVAVTVPPGAALLVRGHALGDSGVLSVNGAPVAARWTSDSVRVDALPVTLPTGSPLSVDVAPARVPRRSPPSLSAGTVTIEAPPPPRRHDDASRIVLRASSYVLRVGETRVVQAVAYNDSGRVLTPQLQLQFTTENPAFATVAPTGNDRGLLRGQGPGTTQVTVSQPNMLRTSARVTVRDTASGTGSGSVASGGLTGPSNANAGEKHDHEGTFTSGAVSVPSEFRLPDDAPFSARGVGPFAGPQRTATIRLPNGAVVGYAKASSWVSGAAQVAPGAVSPTIEVTMGGAPRLDQPGGSPVMKAVIFDARSGVDSHEYPFTVGGLEYRLRLDPATRIVKVAGQPAFSLDATHVLVRVARARTPQGY